MNCSNIFLPKNRETFAMQKAPHISSAKSGSDFAFSMFETLTSHKLTMLLVLNNQALIVWPYVITEVWATLGSKKTYEFYSAN